MTAAKSHQSPISERILQLLNIANDSKLAMSDVEAIVSTACIAWNMAIFRAMGITSFKVDSPGAPDREMLMGLIEGLAIRKANLFPEDFRIILGFEVKQLTPLGQGGVGLSISSIHKEDCFNSDGSVAKDIPSGNVLRWQEVAALFGPPSKQDH